MKNFFASYKWIFIIGALLLFSAGILSWWLSPSQEDSDEQVSKIYEKIDKAYENNATVDQKRRAIISAIHLENTSSKIAELGLHLAEALFLAGIMVLTAEAVTKYFESRDEHTHLAKISADFDQRIHEISNNVWQAMVRKIVPEKIGTEILNILKSDVCRFHAIYAVTLQKEPFSDLMDNEIVVKRELSYEISNLTGTSFPYPLRIEVKSHTGQRELGYNGLRVTLPRICEVTVDGVSKLKEPATTFEEPVKLNADHKICTKIHSVVEEICKLNDRALYVLREPCVGVELHIDNEIPHLVALLHDQVYMTSGTKRLARDIGMRWSYEDAVLSGTALSVAWEPTRKALPANVSNALLDDTEIV